MSVRVVAPTVLLVESSGVRQVAVSGGMGDTYREVCDVQTRPGHLTYTWRDYHRRLFAMPVYASRAERAIPGVRPVQWDDVWAYVEEGCDPERALANLIAHLGDARYLEGS
jgi:hypothetical protein